MTQALYAHMNNKRKKKEIEQKKKKEEEILRRQNQGPWQGREWRDRLRGQSQTCSKISPHLLGPLHYLP
jgi:hypothetical protein